MTKPKIAVLLAAYNGEKYIREQILSILNQKDVEVHIFISIDKSTDSTLGICKELQHKYHIISIINEGKERFGSAGKNFYHLIKIVDFEFFDYIALSDQDDIWKPYKLIRGIETLAKEKAAGYSSDVECFWEDGSKKNKIIKKSYPQKKYDYLFEPAGPGCTYILTKNLANSFKENIIFSTNLPYHHDWYIYAFSRSNNQKWVIDNYASLYYRQHSNNQVGANHGLHAIISRLKILRSGEYKKYHQEILKKLNIKINSTGFGIYKNPFQLRRKKTEAILLFFFKIARWI